MLGPVSCTVSYVDIYGVTHTVEVTASSLYEAMALGIVAFRKAKLIDCNLGSVTELQVEVRQPGEKHSVKVRRLENWVASGAKSPAEHVLRVRLQKLLEEQ